MIILAIETSTMLGGIALMGESEGLIFESRLNVKTAHSERLMTEIDHALKRTGMNISEIDVFGIAIGPGSFTGLRIGLSTVKGFSYATGKPIVCVPTLEAVAWHFPYSPYPVCAMFDARKKEVYAAVFRWKDDGFERMVNETSVKVSEMVKSLGGKVLFAGDGALLYREVITDILADRALFPPLPYMVPSPSNVAHLGLKKALRGELSEPLGLVPLYLRKSEAEVKMDSRTESMSSP
ncbi:MAG TPA: tRNA (adenosine(37)-N6)-threonylcarbamoyltransferase complex dimerization subunit type 1 TsaB [Thermodesulfovibrionales bacterium]|nr:tRNA (adenosine(37)-N6)-threonylcarbamoyltransferase complex dimerization subunit type 1 TsaB [Thermodesulfovibrionales bacterium]